MAYKLAMFLGINPKGNRVPRLDTSTGERDDPVKLGPRFDRTSGGLALLLSNNWPTRQISHRYPLGGNYHIMAEGLVKTGSLSWRIQPRLSRKLSTKY